MDDMQQMRLTSSCAKVFVGRDYSEGIGVKFETKLPQELIGKVEWLGMGLARKKTDLSTINMFSNFRSMKTNLSKLSIT
jgi:hypothetical protein